MNTIDSHPPKQSDTATGRESKPKRRWIDSSELLDQQNEVIIVHHGSEYRLRLTSNDKLILTK